MTAPRTRSRRCARHAFGDIAHEDRPLAGTTVAVFRAECACGWSTPWWGSVVALLADVHAHRYARRGARRFR